MLHTCTYTPNRRPVILRFCFQVFTNHPTVPHLKPDGHRTIYLSRDTGWPHHALLTHLCMLACLQPPKTWPYFTRSLSHPSYPQSPLPGTSLCTHRRRRRRWQRGWPLAGWGKFLDKVPKHPPGSRCCEPRPTWRVLELLSLKLGEKCTFPKYVLIDFSVWIS